MTQPHVHKNRLFQLLNDADTTFIIIKNAASGEVSLGIQNGTRIKISPMQERDILAYGSKDFWRTSTELLDLITAGAVEVPATQIGPEAGTPAQASGPTFIEAPADAAAGDLIGFNGSTWVSIPPGATPGDVLTSNGAGALPTYQAGGGGGLPGSHNLGDMLVSDGTNWQTFAPGASGTVITSNGPGAAPTYQAASAGPTGVETLIYNAGGNAIDFDPTLPTYKQLGAFGDVILTSANLAAGRQVSILISTLFASVNFTFPVGWVFINGGAPASQDALKSGILSLVSWGAADGNVIAAYSVQP